MYDPKKDPTMFDVEGAKKRLKRMDRALYLEMKENGIVGKIDFIFVGSICLLMRNIGKHYTEDMDAIKISQRLPEDFLVKYNVNTKCQNILGCFPYNFENRVEKIELDTLVCDFYILSLEDVVIAKIGAYRPKDRKDIESMPIIERLNFEKLKQCAIEIEWVTYGERSWKEFKTLYNIYVELCEEKLGKVMEEYKL